MTILFHGICKIIAIILTYNFIISCIDKTEYWCRHLISDIIGDNRVILIGEKI
jgi:hypothetical protein